MRTKILTTQWIDNKIVQAVRQGLVMCIPLLMLGSIALVLKTLPIVSYQAFLHGDMGKVLLYLLELMSKDIFDILSLVLVVSIAYSYAELREEEPTTCIIIAIVALCAYIIYAVGDNGFSTEIFTIAWLFTSMCVASAASVLFIWVKGLRNKMGKKYIPWADTRVRIAMEITIPSIVVIVVFSMLNYIIVNWLHNPNIQEVFLYMARKILGSFEGGWVAAMVYVFFLQIFWFFGMHGGNILDPMAKEHFETGLTTNINVLASGGEPSIIFTKTFFDVFVFIGGCGSLLCLVIAILLRGKSTKRIGKLSITSILFNINEILVFGMPIVLNPIMFIPFILTPLVLTIVSYIVFKLGWVPMTIQSISWVTPVFISGAMATQSWAGAVLQLVNVIIGVCIYIPFVEKLEKRQEGIIKTGIEAVTQNIKELEESGQECVKVQGKNDLISMRKYMINDLEQALHTDALNLYYQPQHNIHGELIGVEALLRWNHYAGGFIYPPLIIDLAREGNLIDELGEWVLQQACKDLETLKSFTDKSMKMSINIVVEQLSHPVLVDQIENVLERYNILPSELGIEITEQVALRPTKEIEGLLARLRGRGVQILMDDFGMGHSSISYLQNIQFDVVKLDGSLVREVLHNKRSRDIIESIIKLAKRMDFDVIAEYVETEEQRQVLEKLGCNIYQGYLYSPAMPFSALAQYVSDKRPYTTFREDIYSNMAYEA